MAKKKWYKSKGGWIGVGVYALILFSNPNWDTNTIVKFPFGYLFKSSNNFPIPDYTPIIGLLLNIILYFVAGYFIQKKLSKKRRK